VAERGEGGTDGVEPECDEVLIASDTPAPATDEQASQP